MKEYIDLSSWERRDNFLFFADFLNPFYSVTCEVDCSVAKKVAKERGESFFLYYLYAILDAVNTIDELKYRISEKDEIVRYDKIDAFVPIKKAGARCFTTILIPYHETFSVFKEVAKSRIDDVQNVDPYSLEKQNKEFDVVIVSPLPQLPFTSITYTQKNRHGSDYPIINVGQLSPESKLPIAINVHHGFVDGEHLSEFYSKIEATLASI